MFVPLFDIIRAEVPMLKRARGGSGESADGRSWMTALRSVRRLLYAGR